MRDQYFVVVLTAIILCAIQSKAEVAGSVFGDTVQDRLEQVERARVASIAFPQATRISMELEKGQRASRPQPASIGFLKTDHESPIKELEYAR